ncbi:hypothetical protein SORDD21_00242 [Streptococcus oralis]|uniref:Uncharacterized protein n=1 Tax=Streptococcus oralis TaxID=1303 RepID=A0A139PRW7_STROR|nr:hypothetical protein SORDD21_00242 [Streptococcus oralis]
MATISKQIQKMANGLNQIKGKVESISNRNMVNKEAEK